MQDGVDVVMQRILLEEEIRTINFNSLFRYGSSVLGEKMVDLFLVDIDLDAYLIMNPYTRVPEPMELRHLTEECDFYISNRLSTWIMANAKRSLPGNDPLFEAGRNFIRNLPHVRKRISWIKLLTPRTFFNRIVKENAKYNNTRILEIDRHVSPMNIVLKYHEHKTRTREGKRIDKSVCDWYRGCCYMYLDLLGGKNIRINETACAAEEDDHCALRIEWDSPSVLRKLKNFLIYTFAKEIVEEVENAIAERDVLVHELERIIDERTVELKQAMKELQQLSYFDQLTELPNRRQFEEYYDKQWRSLRRNEIDISKQREKTSPEGELYLSVIICDLDYFKYYNDTYGHSAGDACLRRVSQAIRESVHRPDDLPARFGGEEFIIVLPNTPLEGAKHVADNILNNVRSLKIPHRTSSVDKIVTISIGIAERTYHRKKTSAALVEAADKALYAAKEAGRNRYVIY
jgi:diguanylate cyclase (GGDEF)-like protein